MCRGFPRRLACTALSTLLISAGGCERTPTSPERYGLPFAYIICDGPSGTITTACRAPVSCSMYRCPAGTPTDVTAVAVWTVDNTAVARVVAPGVVESVRDGHTVLRASWTHSSYFVPIGVFPGTGPLQTYEYAGMVFDGAAAPRTPLDGVTVEIISGLAAGRTTVSGAMPDLLPGSTAFPGSGRYIFFGIPSGTYRLRLSKPGYVTQEVETRQFADVTLTPER